MTNPRIETPYYTIQYLLREFANGLGTKGIDPHVAKKLMMLAKRMKLHQIYIMNSNIS
jgi:hypothetical protein